MNINPRAMYDISIDSTRQALQTNRKLFFNSESFFELPTIFKNNGGVGFMQARWGRHLY